MHWMVLGMISDKSYQLLISSGQRFRRSTALEKDGRKKDRRTVVRKKAEKLLGGAWEEIKVDQVSGSHCEQLLQL